VSGLISSPLGTPLFLAGGHIIASLAPAKDAIPNIVKQNEFPVMRKEIERHAAAKQSSVQDLVVTNRGFRSPPPKNPSLPASFVSLMRLTTLCFLIRVDEDGKPCSLLLALKKRGFGAGKWNGPGGKVEAVRPAVFSLSLSL
jgi:hypothetical protein